MKGRVCGRSAGVRDERRQRRTLSRHLSSLIRRRKPPCLFLAAQPAERRLLNTSRAVCGCLADADGADDRYVLMHIVKTESEARNAEVGKQVCGFPDVAEDVRSLARLERIERVGGLAVVE